MKPVNVHVFDSRKDVFKRYNVLQEMVILFFDSWRGDRPLKLASVLNCSLKMSKMWCHRL